MDPSTGSDMLETTLVLGITNNAMALKSDDRDASHEMGDYSYFSVGGSAALNTGNMYDYMGAPCVWTTWRGPRQYQVC